MDITFTVKWALRAFVVGLLLGLYIGSVWGWEFFGDVVHGIAMMD